MSKRFNSKLVVAFSIAVVLRVLFALIVSKPTDLGETAEYEAVAAGGAIGTGTAPFYPFFLRAIYAIFGAHNHNAVYVVQGVVSSLIVLIMYRVVSRMWSSRAGCAAAFMCAVYPNFIMYDLTILTEPLGLMLVASMMLAASRLKGDPEAVVQGALAAVGLLLKPVFLFFVPGVIVGVRKRLVFLLVFICILAPWFARNVAVRHAVVPVYDAAVFDVDVGVYVDSGDALDVIDRLYDNASFFLGKRWDTYVVRAVGLKIAATSSIRKYSFTLIMLLGCIGLARYARKEHFAIIAPAAGFVILHVVAAKMYDGRSRVFVEPLLIAYASILIGGGKKEAAPEAVHPDR